MALALALEPELPRLVRRYVMMGGAGRGIGNVTPHAEFTMDIQRVLLGFISDGWAAPASTSRTRPPWRSP